MSMHPRHTASVPNLYRAVAECTQPYGPPASVSAVRSLQLYLTNDSCVDSVYRAILARACAEPQSEPVIAKCISLIRQYVGRHPPSAAVLAAIADACQNLAAALPPSSGVQKSLLYLESSVVRTADNAQGNKRLAKNSARSVGSNASSKGAWPHAAANGDLAGSISSARAAALAAAAVAAGGSMHSSVSEDVHGAQQARAAGPSICGSADQQQHHRRQYHHQQSGQYHTAEQGQLKALEGARAVPDEPVLPSWTFQPSALQELWAHDPDEESDLDWSQHTPQLSPSLVPLVDGLPGMEDLNTLSCQHVVDAITGADVSIQLRQMREITEVRRLQCGVTPELLQQVMQQSLANRSRRLFQPLPYTQQEQADVLASDVAAVVEVMCGKPSPATPSAITGAVGLDDPDTYWQQPVLGPSSGPQQPLLLLYQQTSNLGGQQPPQQQRHAESIGQISSCILVKMVVDLWLSIGGAAAFPLVLRMLQQALYQLQPQYRVRAFDILYNLALHGSMLLPAGASPPPSPQAQPARIKLQPNALAGILVPQEQQQQQQTEGRMVKITSPLGGIDLKASPGSVHSQEDLGRTSSPPQSTSVYTVQRSPGSMSLAAAAAAAAGHYSSSSWSPQQGEASPRGRSRLSRSQLAWMAPTDIRPPQQQQGQEAQQQLGHGSAGGCTANGFVPEPAVAAAGASARGAVGMAAVHEGSSSDVGQAPEDAAAAAAATAAPVPVGVAWEEWLHQLLFELLLMLSMMDEPSEAVWQSALGCLLHLTTHGGHWVASSCSQLPPAAAAALLDACVAFHWSPELHARLVQMAVNLLYLTDHAGSQQQQTYRAVHARCSFGEQSQQQWHQNQQQTDTAVHAKRSLGQQPQQPREANKGLTAAGDHSAAALTSPEDVSVTLDTLVCSRQQQLQQQFSAQETQQLLSQGGDDAAAAALGSEADASDAGSTAQYSSDEARSQMGDLQDLPWQLHAGPVDEQQLASFGGPAKLLQHFCQAASVEAQRTLLVPLLQVLMPHDAPDAAQLAILQALCARPSCLAVLQAAVAAGLPGWSSYVVLAVRLHLGAAGVDVPLLSSLLLRLQQLSMHRMGVPAAAAGGSVLRSSSSGPSSSAPGSNAAEEQWEQHRVLQLPAEVQLAMQLTLQQLVGQLPSRQQSRPGLQATDIKAYQVPAEVQGSWKALRALCWCDDELARVASRHWLQQLLAVTLQQSLKGAILLPLPGVQQLLSTPTDAASAGSAAGMAAACEAWSEVLQQLVTHCPNGTDLLVDALQLHMTACKLHMHHPQQLQGAAGSSHNSGQQQPSEQQQHQRRCAAAARECVQAWAFVCQWVMQARVSSSQAALTRLAAMAHSMSCVYDIPDWHLVAAEAAAAAAAEGADLSEAADAAAATAATGAATGQLPQQGDHEQIAAGVHASAESLMLTGMDTSKDFEAGFKCVPSPEPSSEPSALARLWAGTGAALGQAECPEGSAGQPAAAAADAAAESAAVLAAAEGVCWPQAFLTGCALLIQQMAQVLSGASLALLLVRLLQCRPPSRAADRGFHGRPSSSRAVPAAGAERGAAGAEDFGVMPCPVLYPWSDGRQDLQLGLVLMLISSCSSDAQSFAEFGLEAVTQQVLSGCTDPRVCLLVSQFMLEHLMQHQQDRYWTALRQLVAAAQQANDERLLGNPFLQLVTLLSEQQQRHGSAALGAGLSLRASDKASQK